MVADGEPLYVRAGLHDYAGTLVTEHDRSRHRDSSVSDGQVTVTDTARGEFYQHLALPWGFDLDLFDAGSAAGVAADDCFGFHLASSMPAHPAAFNCCEIGFHSAKPTRQLFPMCDGRQKNS